MESGRGLGIAGQSHEVPPVLGELKTAIVCVRQRHFRLAFFRPKFRGKTSFLATPTTIYWALQLRCLQRVVESGRFPAGIQKGGWPTCVNFLLQAEQTIDVAPRKNAFKRALRRLRVHMGGNFRNTTFPLLRRCGCDWTQQQIPFGNDRQRNKGPAKSKMQIADSHTRVTDRNAKARKIPPHPIMRLGRLIPRKSGVLGLSGGGSPEIVVVLEVEPGRIDHFIHMGPNVRHGMEERIW